MDSSDVIHKRILEAKWKSLEARGITRPRDEGEVSRRLQEASSNRQGNVSLDSSDGGSPRVAKGL